MLDSCRSLQQRGYEVTYLPVNNEGLIDVAQLEASLRPDTALVSVMMINNEIGTSPNHIPHLDTVPAQVHSTLSCWEVVSMLEAICSHCVFDQLSADHKAAPHSPSQLHKQHQHPSSSRKAQTPKAHTPPLARPAEGSTTCPQA